MLTRRALQQSYIAPVQASVILALPVAAAIATQPCGPDVAAIWGKRRRSYCVSSSEAQWVANRWPAIEPAANVRVASSAM